MIGVDFHKQSSTASYPYVFAVAMEAGDSLTFNFTVVNPMIVAQIEPSFNLSTSTGPLTIAPSTDVYTMIILSEACALEIFTSTTMDLLHATPEQQVFNRTAKSGPNGRTLTKSQLDTLVQNQLQGMLKALGIIP